MTDALDERDLIREDDAAVRLSELLTRARLEVGKAVVGHDQAVDLMLISALARGHVRDESHDRIREPDLGTAARLPLARIADQIGHMLLLFAIAAAGGRVLQTRAGSPLRSRRRVR